MEITKTSLKGFRIFALLSLVCALATIVLSCISLATMGEVYGMAPGIGDIITYFYKIHGFFALFLGLLCVAFLFLHGNARETLAKISVWALAILSIMYITPFFTDTIFYLSSVSFGSGLNYFSAHVPALMAAVCTIALLTKWTDSDPFVTNRVALVCSLVSIFMCIVYLVQATSLLGLTSTLHDNAQVWGLIFGNLGVTFASVFIWALTSSRRRFERLMYDMSDREALAFELVEQRVDTESRRIEAEVDAELSAPAPVMREQPEEVRRQPEQAPAPPPPEPPPEEPSRGRFIPASENLDGELPLQRKPKSSGPDERNW